MGDQMTLEGSHPGEPHEPLARVDHTDPNSPLYAPTSDGGVMLCLACRGAKSCQMGLRTETVEADGLVVSELVCGLQYEGGPNVASGAWTAGVLNELVGHAVLAREFAVSAWLNVTFRKPTPIETPLVGKAQIDRYDGKKVYVSATIELPDGALLASAEAMLVRRSADHFTRHQQWLADRNQPQDPH